MTQSKPLIFLIMIIGFSPDLTLPLPESIGIKNKIAIFIKFNSEKQFT